MSASPAQPPPGLAEDRSPVAPAWHTVVFVVVTLGLTFYQAKQTPQMANLRLTNRLPLYTVMILFELVLLAYVWLLGLRPAGKKLRDIVGGKWNTWADFWVDAGIAAGSGALC